MSQRKQSQSENLDVKDILVSRHEDTAQNQGAIVPPIFQNSLFAFADWDAIDSAFDDPINNSIYTRGNNPSVTVVEKKIADLANGERAKLFASGMGAISSAIMHCIKANSHVITIKNIYGPTSAFFNSYLPQKCNVSVTFIDGRDVEEFRQAIRPETSLIYLESPSSAIFTLQDLKGIAQLAKAHNIKTVIDNTWATPLFQKALDLGIDIEVHSCSKYLGGHSDIVSGVAIGSKADIDSLFMQEHALYGAKMAPFEAWLLLRSLRTFDIRMKQHQASAQQVVDFLDASVHIASVAHPGSKDFAQKELAHEQMAGFSGLMSFQLNTEELPRIKTFLNSLRCFKIGVSWGGHESLAFAPAISYLKEMPEEHFKATGLSLADIRISVGLESPETLIEDIKQALELAFQS